MDHVKKNPKAGLIIYVSVVVLTLIAGISLLYVSSLSLSASEMNSADGLVNELERLDPAMTNHQAVAIKASLKNYGSILEQETWKDALMRDIGIGLFVAVILTLAMEAYARRRLQDEIRTGVIEAAFERLIPSAVFQEVCRSVIGAVCVKRRWEVRMIIQDDKTISAAYPDHYVSMSTLQYDLHNTANFPVLQTISIGLDEDVRVEDSEGLPLPRFIDITIGEKRYSGTELKELLAGTLEFTTEVKLQPGHIRVAATMWEVVRVPDTYVWSTPTMADGVSIVIDSSNVRDAKIAFAVAALHSERVRMEERHTGSEWRFRGGMLPWQGFQIITYDPTKRMEQKNPAKKNA